MSDHHRRLFSIFAVLVVSLVALPSAGASGPATPVLWEGVLRTPDGQPAAGEAVAFVRPPASRLQPGDQLAELARDRTDGSGRFVLRAGPSAAVRAAQDESGWVTVMVFAFSERGVALGIDAVAWRPDPGIHGQSADGGHGRWISDPADLDASHGRFRAAEAGSVPQSERPASLVLDGEAPDRILAMEDRGRPPVGMTCGLQRSKDMGIHQVAVGEIHLRDAWGGLFEYTNTRSTSFQAGISFGGRGWQVGGSDSVTASNSLAQAKAIAPADRDDPQVVTYKAELLFKRFDWRCSKNGYRWEDISTLQPVSWPNGGMREVPASDAPRCGSDERFFGTVVPDGRLRRDRGSSITLGGAIAVAGFTGSITSAIAEGVSYQWHNARPFHRAVCGSTNVLQKDTRVATSGMR
jgi:hypothetical protein